MSIRRPTGEAQGLTVSFGSPPSGVDAEVLRERQERSQRNSQWLQTHWDQLLPAALGKFVAVAGEEGFIAETPQRAWAWVQENHPEDNAATVHYVDPRPGPKLYAHRG